MQPSQQHEFAAFVASRSDSLIRLAYVLTNDQHAAELREERPLLVARSYLPAQPHHLTRRFGWGGPWQRARPLD
ncbi:hypothetical protein GCM10010412_009950 [Nonomuraea recticatena]|uniref:Uncharacterized protein n=1 Tax=Nonomuraea recticatena TaxID=46178 RepID=A0ABP6DJQ0_9ACTN